MTSVHDLPHTGPTAPPRAKAGTAAQGRLLALVGNPNCGKSTLFNALTGFRQRVGNYPGVTVEKRVGGFRTPGGHLRLLDLPGSYSLSPRSLDESVVTDAIFGRLNDGDRVEAVIQVADACNLHRHLFLTSQLLETGLPLVLAINMIDLAETAGLRIDTAALSKRLGIPVVTISATRRRGFENLARAVDAALAAAPPEPATPLPAVVVDEAEGLAATLANTNGALNGLRPGRLELVHLLLDGDGLAAKWLPDRTRSAIDADIVLRRRRLATAGVGLESVEGQCRYRWADETLSGIIGEAAALRPSRTDRVDRWLTHRLSGTVVFIAILAVVFQAIYGWAAPLMDLIEAAFSRLGDALGGLLPAGPLQSLLVDGVVAGAGAVFVFLPQILILFFFLALLEDSGYLARGAVLLDRWLRVVGLNGRSFIPLLSSFACAIPGIMSTRTIENRADRLVTILVAPLMSCSARLPVYVLLIGAFVPATTLLGGWIGTQGLVLLAMYLVGIVVAVPVALIVRRLLFRGQSQPFLMELPSYKWPSLRNVVHRMYDAGREFVVRAGTVIVALTIIIWALGYFPRSATIITAHDALRAQAEASLAGGELDAALADIDKQESGALLRHSLLGRMGHAIEPAVRPLGWDWRIGTAVLASFPAREVVIATLGTIYNLGGEEDESSGDLRSALQAATSPDGRSVFSVPVALSIMVFFALCCQCGATLAVIKKETRSWRWPVATFVYMTGLAYVAAWVTYEVGRWLA